MSIARVEELGEYPFMAKSGSWYADELRWYTRGRYTEVLAC